MNYRVLALLAVVLSTVARVQADNFVTITPTATAAATVLSRWTIGGDISGLGYIDGNSGFPSATATNFFTLTGAVVSAGGNPTGFTSYLPSGVATPQGSVGNSLTPTAYSGLTYVAANLGLIGPLSFYAIHHRPTGDYLALIQPSVPTVSDQKPMSMPGGPGIAGATGYFGLSYAADNPGGWGANLFYYLRRNGLGETIFGSLIPALVSGPTDRWNLGANRGFTDLAYTSTDVGFGFGPGQFYYLRLDPLTQTTFFGRINPLTGIATDIQNLGGIYRTLVFTPTDVGYGANSFYSIGRAAQTITFAPIPAHTACDASFSIIAPSTTSSLPITLSVSGPATVSGNIVTLTGATGTVVLTATQLGNSNFAPAPTVTQSFAVTACAPAPTAQTITFAVIPGHTACDAPFTFVLPTASSGLTVGLVVTGPATLSGNTITLTGAVGTVVLTASQVGNGSFFAAPNVAQSFVVAACVPAPTAQTITFAAISAHTACDGPFTFTAPVASSGLPVTLAVSGPATVSGNTVTLTGAVGTVIVTASQAGNGTFAPATSVTQSFAVTACPPLTPQVITFAPVADRGLCDAVFTLSPTSTSGLPVALVVTSGPATIAGNIVTVTGVGSVTIQAIQAGNGTFAAAVPVSRTFATAKCAATITLTNLTNIFYGRDFNALEWIVATTSPAGLNVVLTHEGNLIVPAAVRSYAVVATIVDPRYEGTTTATLVISADPRVAQTVSFGSPALTDRVFGSAPFTLNPTASSGLPTVLSVVSGPATVSGNVVTMTGAGTVVLEVTQPGTILTHFFASLSQSFVVTKAVAPITLGGLAQTFDGTPKSASVATTPAGLAVTTTYNGSITPPTAVGSYAVVAVVNHPNYQGAANGTLTITGVIVPPAPVITNTPLSVPGTVNAPFSFTIAASGSPTSFAASPLPAGLTFDATTGVISGSPSSAGVTNVLLGATSANGTGLATLVVTVAPAGVSPIITNAPLSVGATVGTGFNFTIVASGSPTSYSAAPLPAGLTIATATGTISGTPTSVGTTHVLLSASNSTGTGQATLTVTVASAGAPPIITNNPLTAAGTVGIPFGFTISASGSPASYDAGPLPAGLAVVSATGIITGIPTASGSTTVQLGASNASGRGNATLIITIAAAAVAPVISNTAIAVAATVGTPFSYIITASGLPLSYNAVGLPPGLSASAATGVISGTPTAVGTSVVTLAATNASGTGNLSITLTVAPATIAPIITSPASAPGTLGLPFVTYLVAATGLPTSYSATGLPTGLTLDPLTGAINGTPTATGTFLVTTTASNSAGVSTATLTITVAPATVAPIITSPSTAAGVNGQPFATYLIAATGLPTTYAVTGLPAGLTVNPLTGAITGTPTASGTFIVTLTATNSTGASSATVVFTVEASSRIVNFSARALSGPGDQTLIMGFVIAGDGKNLLVRAIGPGLSAHGVVAVLADPMLTVFASTVAMASNDDWQTNLAGAANGPLIASTAARVGAFPLANASKDGALLLTANRGALTTSLARPNSGTGVALTEIYDTDISSNSRLINVSARMNIAPGEGALIAGFVIAGDAPKTVLIRGVGPTLAAFAVAGVLADPVLTVFAGSTQRASNDNWDTGSTTAAQITAASARVGAFALVPGSRDAALLLVLEPGSYTVQVTGVGNTTGVALVEIYDTP